MVVGVVGRLLVLVLVGRVGGQGRHGLEGREWRQVTDRASLSSSLSCSFCLLGLGVTNGTEWLQIGGRDDTFLPIVTADSQVTATSDLSLEAALTSFRDDRPQGSTAGLFIYFRTPSILPSSLRVHS